MQIREKDLCDRDLYALTRAAVDATRGMQCRILVNGRADIALAAGAHGVHLPAVGLRIPDIRSWLPKGFLIGASAHSMREAARAVAEGVDYVLFGPLYATGSKLRYGPPVGLNRCRLACRKISTPLLGLGGIHAEHISSVLGAGAAGVAGIGLFQKKSEFRKLRALRKGGGRKYNYS